MPNVPLATERAARKYGISPALLKALINQESGGNPNARSPAGAEGIAQFIPSTAKAYNVNLNDGRITDDLEGAAHYLSDNLKRTGGNVTQALSIYNSGRPDGYKTIAETSHYVKTILAAARAHGGNAAGTSSPHAVSAPSSTTTSKYTPGTSTFEPDTTSNGAGLSDLIAAQLSGQRQQAAPAAMLQDPSYSASKYVSGATLPQASGAMVKPRMDVGAVLQALEAAPAVSDVQTTPGKLTTSTTPGASVAPAAGASGKATGLVALGGRAAKAEPFKVTGPDPGRLNKDLVSFARKVATIYGAPLTGSSGATHSKYTVDGNISDHYAGNATDIPASGKELIRMGRAALIAAGMPRKQALKQTGGLFNVNGHQVIFRTMQGGNHFDHLHVSAK